ncbi:tRNA (guanine(26)-N(2))-dimethyltransferase [Halosegnis sp.]|uniref:tRNA (guanine(26)-N(2))-dimethyltransferase n=1 Tax=Halosegnis sp. TaxID=2864959 RepID=UPI0035D43680
MELTEGGVRLTVPEVRHGASEGAGEGVFFNPAQELNRDLTVAVLRTWADRGYEDGGGRRGTYLDATCASGVRGVRAAAEGWDVTCTDVDETAVKLAAENLERNGLDGNCEQVDAKPHLYQHHYNVVDLDPFGTPAPFLDAAFNGTTELLCVTATDTAPLCGAHFESGVRKYATVPRNTEFHPEMGVRVLLSACIRAAARYDVAATPVFTHATSHYVRTYLAVTSGAQAADERIGELGYVDWCRDCYWRDHERGLIAAPTDSCPNCGTGTTTAGPLWLGATHDRAFAAAVGERVDESMGEATKAKRLCDRLADERHDPTHYDQHELSGNWGVSAVAMEEFLGRLRAAGHPASRTHYGGTTFKTPASVAEIKTAVI